MRSFFEAFHLSIGEVNNKKFYFFSFWFDKDLLIKKIGISSLGLKPENEIYNA
jgi:hypothetical protein